MSTYAKFGQQDDALATTDKDSRFIGVNNRLAPDKLPEGMLADGQNTRVRTGEAAPRLGVVKLGWLNALSPGVDSVIRPVDAFYGSGVFHDPNGTEWVLLASDGLVWRHKPHNMRASLPLPQGVRILSDVTFTQAFNRLFMFRGRYLQPLVLDSVDDGFKDLVPRYDPAKVYQAEVVPLGQAADEMAYGPFRSVQQALTVTGLTMAGPGQGGLNFRVKASVSSTVGLQSGMLVTIAGAAPADYNGTFTIYGVDPANFFYYDIPTNPVAASGAITCTVGLTQAVGGVCTVSTSFEHGFVTGQDVTIRGATPNDYNGRWSIVVLDSNTFTFEFPTPGVPTPTGNVQISAMQLYWRAIGTAVPVVTLAQLGGAGLTAIATTAAPHGFNVGEYVTITGASPAGYDGQWVITAATATTFNYVMLIDPNPGTSATGTITARNSVVQAGHTPDTNPDAWQQIYNILPNADDALFVNDRLLVPTAYTPGQEGVYDSTSGYTKKDFIVATDYLDYVHFDFANEFRINQGGDDEIVQLVKYAADQVIVLKGKSWGIITGLATFSADLSTALSLDMHMDGYGACALRGGTVAGKDVVFGSSKRGVCSLAQNTLGQTRSVDIPFSNDVSAWVDRINWNHADKIRAAWWNDCLYVAVPLDDGRQKIKDLIPGEANYGAFPYLYPIHGLRPGRRYHFVSGANERGLLNTLPEIGTPEPDEVVEGDFEVLAGSVPQLLGRGNMPVTASITEVAGQDEPGNNAVLVYDFRMGETGSTFTYDFRSGQWAGLDVGSAICVKEWFKATYNGLERLFFIGADGYCNMVEEGAAGDQIAEVSAPNGLGWEEMDYRAATRGYAQSVPGQKAFKRLEMVLHSWNANFTVTARTGAASSDWTVREAVNFSRRKYLKPVGKADYVEGAADWDQSGRGDYSVALVPAGIPEIEPSRFQEFMVRPSLRTRQGRYVQFTVTSDRGRVRLVEVTPEVSEGQRRSGILI